MNRDCEPHVICRCGHPRTEHYDYERKCRGDVGLCKCTGYLLPKEFQPSYEKKENPDTTC